MVHGFYTNLYFYNNFLQCYITMINVKKIKNESNERKKNNE